MRIVAAANPPEQASYGWDLSAPPANRLIHLDWQMGAAAVAEGFTGGFAVPDGRGGPAPSRGQRRWPGRRGRSPPSRREGRWATRGR
ncbi:hypothetical protein AB0B45_03455 [Nonomuraea sp. NPDC049152]|uniref:hypothetical protein n=1 Tax=Nonomuraea sp. NPDC049152 TaxID=3154350 RepID=UPI0033E88AD4